MDKTSYSQHPKLCPVCQQPLRYEQRRNRYCSHSCAADHCQNSRPDEMRRRSEEVKRRMKEGTWKKPNPPRTPLSPRVTKPCETCDSPMQLRPSEVKRRFCSKVCSSKGKIHGSGGYREGSGRGKTGWYKGYYCASSWELAWIIYHLDHQITFKKNANGFPYVWEDQSRLYYPDYIMGDGSYLEIKGYTSEQWKAKLTQFPHPIKVMYKADMKPILEYVTSRYGFEYLQLYDGNPHDIRKNSCKICGKPAKRQYCCQRCSGQAVAALKGWDKSLSRPN